MCFTRKDIEILKSGLCDIVQVLQFIQGFIESDDGLSKQFHDYKTQSVEHKQLAIKAKAVNQTLLSWYPEHQFQAKISQVIDEEGCGDCPPVVPNEPLVQNEHQHNQNVSEATKINEINERANIQSAVAANDSLEALPIPAEKAEADSSQDQDDLRNTSTLIAAENKISDSEANDIYADANQTGTVATSNSYCKEVCTENGNDGNHGNESFEQTSVQVVSEEPLQKRPCIGNGVLEKLDGNISFTEMPISEVHASSSLEHSSNDERINTETTDECDTIWKRLRQIKNFKDDMVDNLRILISPTIVKYVKTFENAKVTNVRVDFEKKKFFASGKNLKHAKTKAAQQIIVSLIGLEKFRELLAKSSNTVLPVESKSNGTLNTAGIPSPNNEQSNFGQIISDRVCKAYNELCCFSSVFDSPFLEHKVLAGVVVTTSSPLKETWMVVALASGTKWVHREFISTDGSSVNDCHAEILATRCAREFLYEQIDLLGSVNSETRKNSILEHNTNANNRQRYKLRDGVKFHLYISRPPCGGARIIDYSGSNSQNTPSSGNNDPLTAKDRSRNGTTTVSTDTLFNDMGEYAVDLILPGNSNYRMSCYDKICRWNVLGFQGALLHNLIGQVHFSTITFGVLKYPVNCTRSMHDRLSSLNSQLPSPFFVHEPELLTVPQQDRNSKEEKSPEHALCWTMGWNEPEVLAGNNGTCVYPDPMSYSKLSKKKLFQRYADAQDSYLGDVSYHNAKMEAVKYQEAKEKLKNYFKEQNMGTWISNSVEDNLFTPYDNYLTC